jgi:hypothetical protein
MNSKWFSPQWEPLATKPKIHEEYVKAQSKQMLGFATSFLVDVSLPTVR